MTIVATAIFGAAPADPLALDISPTSLNKFGVSCPITTAAATGNATGGTPPYSFAWSHVSGDVYTINSPTSDVTTFTRTADGGGSGTYKCVVTDDVSDTAEDSLVVSMECGT